MQRKKKTHTLPESTGGKVNSKKETVLCFGDLCESSGTRFDLILWGGINFMSQAIGSP